jgi:hypothetical protein
MTQAKSPLPKRSRRRWAIAGGIAAAWLALEVVTGSAISATVILLTIAVLAIATVAGLRTMGITRNHPWLRRMAYVFADESIPPGRYRLRQGLPVGGAPYDVPDVQYEDAAPELAYAAPSREFAEFWTQAGQRPAPTMVDGMTTVMEQGLAPALRLVTGSSVVQTLTSGARAGRGVVELVLPDVPTVSREHATFTFSDGRWWVTNQGRNGLTLNGAIVAGEQPVSDGDVIRWGTGQDAPLSRVEIG